MDVKTVAMRNVLNISKTYIYASLCQELQDVKSVTIVGLRVGLPAHHHYMNR